MWQTHRSAAIFAAIFIVVGGGGLLFSLAADYNPKADINQDGTVSTTDISLLLAKFDSVDDACDLNNDGVVNLSDLSIALSNLGKKSPATPARVQSLGLNASADPNAVDSQVATRLGAHFRRADIRDLNGTLAPGGPPVLAILYPSWDASGVQQVKAYVERNHTSLIGISIGNESGYAHNVGTYTRGAEYAAFWRQLMAAKPGMSTGAKNIPFIMDFDSAGRGDSPEAARWAVQIIRAGFPNPDMIELHAYGPNSVNKLNNDIALLPTSWHGAVAVTETGVQVRYINGVAYQPGKTYGDAPQPMTPDRGAAILRERVQSILAIERVKMVSVYSAYDTAPGNEGEDHFWGMAYHDGSDKPYLADTFRNLMTQVK